MNRKIRWSIGAFLLILMVVMMLNYKPGNLKPYIITMLSLWAFGGFLHWCDGVANRAYFEGLSDIGNTVVLLPMCLVGGWYILTTKPSWVSYEEWES